MSSDPITEGLKAQLDALGTGSDFVTIEWLDEWMAKTGALLQDRLVVRQTLQFAYGDYRRKPIPYGLAEFRQSARRAILQVIADREASLHFVAPTKVAPSELVAAPAVPAAVVLPEKVTLTWVRNHVPMSWLWRLLGAFLVVLASGAKAGAWLAHREYL